MILYVFRRRLGLTPEQTVALPWWERQVYLEGLNAEFPDPDNPQREVVQATPSNLSALGIQARSVGGGN